MKKLCSIMALSTLLATTAHAQTLTLRVHAAGSLRAAMTDAAMAFEAATPGTKLALTFGASGLLKDRIAAGEGSDVFASANMAHPEALAAAGRSEPAERFTRNAMCVLARPGLEVTADNLLARLMDPALKLGVSTPRADPAGDYAVQVFERIEKNGHPGAAATLQARALQLTGGPNSAPPPADRNAYGALVAQGAADLFLTYCTSTVVAVREQSGQRSVPVPEPYNVSASYGVAVLKGAPPQARQFVDFLLGPAGQALLARHGFAPR